MRTGTAPAEAHPDTGARPRTPLVRRLAETPEVGVVAACVAVFAALAVAGDSLQLDAQLPAATVSIHPRPPRAGGSAPMPLLAPVYSRADS